jgi:hypothetical protein
MGLYPPQSPLATQRPAAMVESAQSIDQPNPVMPSFDVVSEVDWQEIRNAVDQANKEISTRFDFKGSDARVERNEERMTIHADDDFKVEQVMDILRGRMAKRGIELGCLDAGEIRPAAGGKAQQEIVIRHGIDQSLARDLVKQIKASKIKVQVAVQGDQLRVSGKKRDDLQAVIGMLKESGAPIPLQYVNFRD